MDTHTALMTASAVRSLPDVNILINARHTHDMLGYVMDGVWDKVRVKGGGQGGVRTHVHG